MTESDGSGDLEGFLVELIGSVAAVGERQRLRDLNLRELPSHLDSHNLAETGWGIVWGSETRKQVEPLLQGFVDWREEDAEDLFQEVDFQGKLSEPLLWVRHQEAPGVIDPKLLPYYLLLVGSPEEIPFQVQHDLSINRAVGRLYFSDPQDYERYTDTVRRLEKSPWDHPTLPQRVDFFCAETDGTSRLLAKMLIEHVAPALEERAEWPARSRRGKEATRENFLNLLAEDPSGILLASSHGKPEGFGSDRQEAGQGALLLEGKAPLRSADIEERWPQGETPFAGLIAGLFACYSAGTPGWDNFPFLEEVFKIQRREVLTRKPEGFVAALPQALLARGAAAVIGHVDRGWTSSFEWRLHKQHNTATRSLEDSLYRLLEGHRLGHALRPLFRRSQNLAAHVLPVMEAIRAGGVPPEVVINHCVAYVDARNYLILGDPAVYAPGCAKKRQKPQDIEEESAEKVLWPAYLDATLLAKVRQEVGGAELRPWLERAIRRELEREELGEIDFDHRSLPEQDFPEARPPASSSLPVASFDLHSVGVDFELHSPSEEEYQRLKAAVETHALLHPIGDREWPTCLVHQLPSDRLPDSAHLLSGWVLSDGDALLAPARKTEDSTDPLGQALEDLRIAARRHLLLALSDRLGPNWLDVQLRQVTPDGRRPLTPAWEPRIDDSREMEINVHNRSDRPLHLLVLNLGCGGGPPTTLFPQPDEEATVVQPGESRRLDSLEVFLPQTFPFHRPEHRPAAGWEEYLIFAAPEPVAVAPFFEGSGTVDRGSPLARILAAILADGQLPVEDDLRDPGWTVERKTVGVVG